MPGRAPVLPKGSAHVLGPAADAVLQVLVLLARQLEPVPAATVAASLGLPRSTTYRLLGALVDAGFVSYLPEERRYGLGVVAFELGSSYSRQMPLRRVAQPVLTRLVSATMRTRTWRCCTGRTSTT